MILQRVRAAESRMNPRLSNGPLRAQSNVCFTEYSATCWHTSVVGGMLVSRKSAQHMLRIKVAPRISFIRP